MKTSATTGVCQNAMRVVLKIFNLKKMRQRIKSREGKNNRPTGDGENVRDLKTTSIARRKYQKSGQKCGFFDVAREISSHGSRRGKHDIAIRSVRSSLRAAQ